MSKYRLSFKKYGSVRFISHLDLMRTFQRSFFRADLQLKHTQGFNPHPHISIALPLPLGFTSECELVDFELENTGTEDIIKRLSPVLPEGILPLECYSEIRPVRELIFCDYEISLKYVTELDAHDLTELEKLLNTRPLIVMKKSKRQNGDTDISPGISTLKLEKTDTGVKIYTILTAQNPSTNPQYLVAAINRHMPKLSPVYAEFCRKNVLDINMQIFK